MKHTLLGLYIFAGLFLSISFADSTAFPVQDEMRTRVDFWKKVYTEVNSDEALMHDPNDLSIIYGKVKLAKSPRKRKRIAKKFKKELKHNLQTLIKKDFQNLDEKEEKLLKIIRTQDKARIQKLIKSIRFQYGLKDRYYQGLIRSYAYLDYIKATFKQLGLPDELVYLPHVESSFNYKAYSKVGAAGIWQFMRSTGRLYKLKISYVIDERRDVHKATKAAARLLKDNYRILNSWPLALTAYNHGARSMQRAKAKLGTDDINEIIKNYKGRRFGFASKNFYATFMATVEISKDPSKYFPSFEKPKKFIYDEIKLNKHLTIRELIKLLKVKKKTIREYNPAIRATAYRNSLYLPKGFHLKIPKTSAAKIVEIKTAINNYKPTATDFELQNLHVVSRGESLFDISRAYRVSLDHLIIFNKIDNPSRIYPGLKLKIPGKKDQKKLAAKAKQVKSPVQLAKTIEDKKPILKPLSAKNIKKDPQVTKGFFKKMQSYLNAPTKDKEVENNELKDKIAKTKRPMPEVNLASFDLELKSVGGNLYELTIENEETLGHYAEWARVYTSSIRRLNNIRSSNIGLGKKITVEIKPERLNRFKELRSTFHLSTQEDFYENFSASETFEYTVKKGDNLTNILNQYEIPFWLARKVQKDYILKTNLRVGQKLLLPKIKKIDT